MKQLYLIGNLKMNMQEAQLTQYFNELAPLVKSTSAVVGVCVPFVYLPLARNKCEGTNILFGAQNMHYATSGAFTGEISAAMLGDFNVNLVLVGHSERRQYFGESNETVAEKIKTALQHGLTPILCVGETLAEREAGKTKQVIKTQVLKAVGELTEHQLAKLWLAYEPVWAIGTGTSASAFDAQEAIAYVKEVLKTLHPSVSVPVLYGGSLKSSNAAELLGQPAIDGGLIGGASLNAQEFARIINTKV